MDVFRRVVRHADFHPGRQLSFDVRQRRPHRLDHLQRIGRRQHPYAHERGFLAAEPHLFIVGFRAELDVGNVSQPDIRPALFAHDEVAKFLRRSQIGVGREVHGHHPALGGADGGQIVVRRQRLPHFAGRDVPRCQPVGFQPDPHRKGARAENLGLLYAGNRRQFRLNHPQQVICDLVLVEILRIKTQVRRREPAVAGFDVHHRRLGFRRQIIADLRDFRLNLRQRRVVVVIEPQMHRDRAQPLPAFRLDVINPVGAGDNPFQRRGDVAAHQVSVGADVGGFDRDHGDVAARVLPDVQRAVRLQPGQQDDQVDHRRHDRTADE